MPAVSKKQQRYFGYLLSNPEERKKKGISKKAAKDFAQDVKEVAPPGWGHTKAEKEKTKPWKPKSKIGGSADAFKKDLDSGKFKGLPGDKTKKEKTASMFKLMWSMKKKGAKPHYKPGTDEKKKKYQDESFGFEIDSGKHKTAQKKSKMRNLARNNENPNEKAAAEKKAGGPKLVGEAVKGQDTESRKEGAKERATEKRAHAAWKPGTKKRPLYSTTRHTKGDAENYATQQKQSIDWHDKRTKGKHIPGTTTEAVKDPTKKKPKAPQFNAAKELVADAPYMKPALQQREGVSYKDFTKTAQAAMDRIKKTKEEKLKKNAESARKDRVEKGVRFYDKKGKGYIKKGKKVYT